jgi:hypothetical protein
MLGFAVWVRSESLIVALIYLRYSQLPDFIHTLCHREPPGNTPSLRILPLEDRFGTLVRISYLET